jgi:putative sterol carrier protein
MAQVDGGARAAGSRTGSGGAGHPRPTDLFFARLAQETEEPLLRRTCGTVRFDLREGEQLEHWLVTVDDGAVTVSRRNRRADAVVRVDKAMFDDMVTGSLNAMAAWLRGEFVPEGDLGLVLRFQRLFPGPAAPFPSRSRRPPVHATGATR